MHEYVYGMHVKYIECARCLIMCVCVYGGGCVEFVVHMYALMQALHGSGRECVFERTRVIIAA